LGYEQAKQHRQRKKLKRNGLNLDPGPGLAYRAFLYNNQDHSILMGLRAADNVAHRAEHEFWDINTYDEYLESTIITKVGLVTVAAE
jgi:hypothetical protein